MDLISGALLGPYVIQSKLGAGGMGEVYRARDTRLDRDVAIKVLPRRLADSPEAVARFEREMKAVAALSHRNILTIYDCGSHEGVTYAVMELLEGETLADRLSRGPIPWRDALHFGLSIAEGLSAAHAKGIVHRDIKPGNIFLVRGHDLKILDFGLARLERAVAVESAAARHHGGSTLPIDSPSPGADSHTTPGALVGTIHYMSPEQARGEPAEARSDIFSLGCVLYEMLSGSRPFARETAAETMVAIMKEPAPPLPPMDDAFPQVFEQIIHRCMEKLPERRFQTAQDLAFNLLTVQTSSGSSKPGINFDSFVRRVEAEEPPPIPSAEQPRAEARAGQAENGNARREQTADDPKKILENFRRDFERLADYGAVKGSEAVRKGLGHAERVIGQKMPGAGEKIRGAREQFERRAYAPQGGLSPTVKRQMIWGGLALAGLLVYLLLVRPGFGQGLIPAIAIVAAIVIISSNRERRRERRAARARRREHDQAGRREGAYEPGAGDSSAQAGEESDAADDSGASDRSNASDKLILIAALLASPPFGFLGIHRFYVGKIGTGILLLLTGGGLGIWWMIDLILICCGVFEDANGRRLKVWV